MKDWSIFLAARQGTNGRLLPPINYGVWLGETFRDACITWSKTLVDHVQLHFNSITLTFWGYKLYDNEEDAKNNVISI